MGDPKKLKKKYATPRHPWVAKTIEDDKAITNDYGLKNKREIWKMDSILKKYRDLAKKLIANKTTQGEKEKQQMLDKLQKWGLLPAGASLDDVLSLGTKDIMERRLQSLVFRKGLARTVKQARQFIIHRHIKIGDKMVTFPSYIVSKEEEANIKFDVYSSLNDEEHPERTALSKGIKEEAEAIRPKKKGKIEKTAPEEIKIEPGTEE